MQGQGAVQVALAVLQVALAVLQPGRKPVVEELVVVAAVDAKSVVLLLAAVADC